MASVDDTLAGRDGNGHGAGEDRTIMSVIANMSDGVVVIDTESKILLCNRAAECLLDIDADRVIGRPLEVLQATVTQRPTDAGKLKTQWTEAIGRVDEMPRFDFYFRSSLRKRRIEATLFPVGPRKDRLGAGILLRDVSMKGKTPGPLVHQKFDDANQ